jgi:hypothetical protein
MHTDLPLSHTWHVSAVVQLVSGSVKTVKSPTLCPLPHPPLSCHLHAGCDIPAQGLIGLIRILIPTSCNFFSGSASLKTPKLSVLGFERWVTDREVLPGLVCGDTLGVIESFQVQAGPASGRRVVTTSSCYLELCPEPVRLCRGAVARARVAEGRRELSRSPSRLLPLPAQGSTSSVCEWVRC